MAIHSSLGSDGYGWDADSQRGVFGGAIDGFGAAGLGGDSSDYYNGAISGMGERFGALFAGCGDNGRKRWGLFSGTALGVTVAVVGGEKCGDIRSPIAR